ncbi:putative protein phosphatase 2C 76 [Sesamum angolense]|uniref:PPM-type phosphatase domain-containing protein n=1 Tax=Sesamum angolense TaxID=2727404 RepID=A0AAE1TB30_9LAMI|nr:putative protein phosphatase 2C 76 [Sesamum angolense]
MTMLDPGATSKGPMSDTLPEKDENGGYASGGWKRLKQGHGGSRAAEFLKEHLFENLMKHSEFITNAKLAISQTYQQTDADFLDSEKHTFRDDGSTASTAVLVGNHLYVANVGDSRTIISKAGKAIPLSEDHKPNRSDERKRIENAGGVVMWAGTWRVGGVLAMSRAFGCCLIAQTEEEPESAARKLTETAFSRGSADNITCIVVKFNHERGEPEQTQQHIRLSAEPLETQQSSKPDADESQQKCIADPQET